MSLGSSMESLCTRKSILITGANQGIGFETARILAIKGNNITIACRSESRAKEAVAKLQKFAPHVDIDYTLIDLCDLETVRRCAQRLMAAGRLYDVLILNAGVLLPSESLTKDDFEATFQVNYLAQYMFARLIISHQQAHKHVIRVVCLTSVLHRLCGPIFGVKKDSDKWNAMFNNTDEGKKWRAYAMSKFATAMMSINMSQMQYVSSVAVHPGAVRTEMTQKISQKTRKYIKIFKGILISPQEAAENVIKCVENDFLPGEYQNAKKVGKLSRAVRSSKYCQYLEDLSKCLLEERGFYMEKF